MLSSILNFILFLIFAYLLLYAIYLLLINIKALFFSKKFLKEISPENFITDDIKKNKICVIIFANSKTKNIDELLKALNEQTYEKENYSVQVIFAKDSNSLVYVPDCMSGAQIHCVENEEFFKKDKALNLFIEKLIPTSKFDAYLFLGVNRFVPSEYLSNVNIALNNNKTGVITGKVNIVSEFKDTSIVSRVVEARQEFKNNTLNIAKRMFDLGAVIDSENCVMRSDILEKTGKICFETREGELKYSLFLASNSIKPEYYPYMETYVESQYYNPASAGIQTRLKLFKYYLRLLINKPWYFKELILSLLQPNAAIVLFLYLIVLYSSFKFISSIGIKYVLHLGILYLIVWTIGLFASKLHPVKIFVFVLYPFYSFWFNLRKFTKEVSKRAIQRAIAEERDVKSTTRDAIVTDGKKDVLCKMDLMLEEGMRRVVLRFRKKRVISEGCIRMCDAIENISGRIKAHGLTLKICNNCSHYRMIQDGTVDLLKGKCVAGGKKMDDAPDTLIWNRCEHFMLKEATNVFDNINKE